MAGPEVVLLPIRCHFLAIQVDRHDLAMTAIPAVVVFVISSLVQTSICV